MLGKQTMTPFTQRSIRYAGLTAAATLAAGALCSLLPPAAWLAAPIAALALPALGFAAGASVAGKLSLLCRRPAAGAVTLFVLTPFAPILPAFATLLAAGLFAILGLFLAGYLEAIVAALARERTASVFGGLFVASIALFACTTGFGAAPFMPMLVGLCGTAVALAFAATFASAMPADATAR